MKNSRLLHTLALGVLLVAVGTALGAWLFRPLTPQQLESEVGEIWSPVSAKVIEDSRPADLQVSLTSSEALLSASSGLVTSWSCSPGATWHSGASNFAVDGVPIVNLHTAVPLWRPLSLGDKGEDVRALQQALRSLGYDVAADGELGRYTLEQVGILLGDDEEGTENTGEVDPSRFLWLPQEEVVVQSCESRAGTTLEVGTPLAVPQARLVSAALRESASTQIVGDRVFLIDGLRLPLDSEGNIVSQALVDLQSGESFRFWQEGDQQNPLSGRHQLVEPTEVYAVAPGAVYDIDGLTGCVQSKESSRLITIISSELGQTLVDFDGPAPDMVRIGGDATPCR